MSTPEQVVRMVVARVLREILSSADEADRETARRERSDAPRRA